MTPEQRAVLAPPGLLHGEGRRHGSHQSRPRLAVTGPAPNGEGPTPAAEGEAGEAANFTLNGKVKNAGEPSVPLMSREQAYIFDTMGFLHIKGKNLPAYIPTACSGPWRDFRDL